MMLTYDQKCMRRRLIKFNPKIFIDINFTNSTISCFVFMFSYSIKINSSLLHVFNHNTLIHIQFTIIKVPCGYDTFTYFLYHLSTQYTWWTNKNHACVKLTKCRGKNRTRTN